jgi:hypothetical protein
LVWVGRLEMYKDVAAYRAKTPPLRTWRLGAHCRVVLEEKKTGVSIYEADGRVSQGGFHGLSRDPLSGPHQTPYVNP